MNDQSRSILAILSTDIAGYTKATEKDESFAFSLLAKNRDIILKNVTSRNGHLFKEMADGTFSKFESAIDAAHCAIKIQSEAIARDLPLRIGLHLGDVLQEGDDILGIGVNIADRIQKLAEIGKIYISDDIWRQIKNQPDLDANEIGQHSLQGITGKVTLYDLLFNADGTITEKIEVTHKIKTSDEDGKKIEEETPKIEYLKKIALFFFDNKTGESNLDWLQYGIIYGSSYKLLHEKLVDVYQATFSDTMRKAGYSDGVNIPNPLKRKISLLSSREFWFAGDILKDGNNYKIITELYSVKTSKLIKQREFIGDNIFSIIDNISLQLRYDLDIPSSHIEDTNNELLADIYTSQLKAFELYSTGTVDLRRDENIEACMEKYNSALQYDKDFAMVYLQLSDLYAYYKPNKMSQVCKKAMSLIYKLPDHQKYFLKNRYFTFVEKNPDKCLKLSKLWTKLQPDNFDAHLNLADNYVRLEKLDEAIIEYELLFRLYGTNYKILEELVDLYIRKNNYEIALNKLNDYSINFPDDFRPYRELGKLYELMNEFNKARDSFETASLIEPDNVPTLAYFAALKTKFGDYESALSGLNALMNYDNLTDKEQDNVSFVFTIICDQLGKFKNIIRCRSKQISRQGEHNSEVKAVASLMPNVNFIFYKIDIARNHLMINENNSAEKYIKEVKQLATEPPLIHLVQIFCAELYVLLKNTKETEECLNEGSKLIGQYGLSVFEHEFNRVSGMLHELNNDFDNAIIKYEESIHESPP